MHKYAEYINCINSDVFDRPYSVKEISASLEDAESRKDVISFPVGSESPTFNIFLNVLGYTSITIVDERDLERLDPIKYEGNEVSEFYSIMKDRYSQQGMLMRTSSTTAGRHYADYERICAMFNNQPGKFLQFLPAGIVIVVVSSDNHEYYDTYINSVLATIMGNQVYYVAHRATTRFAVSHQYDLYRMMQILMQSSNTVKPYYLKLACMQMFKTGRYILLREFGNMIGMYERIMPCTVKSINRVAMSAIKCFKLKDIDAFITCNYNPDKFTSNQEISLQQFRYMFGVKPTGYSVNPVSGDGSRLVDFKDPVDYLVGEDSMLAHLIETEIDPVLEAKYRKTEEDKTRPVIIKINNHTCKATAPLVHTTLMYEIIQQYCNILSEIYFNSQKPVYLHNIACFDYNGESYVTVEDVMQELSRDLDVDLNIQVGDNVISDSMEIKADTTQLVRVNAPFFLGKGADYPFDEYEQNALIASLFSLVTQHSTYDTLPYNIPLLGMLCCDDGLFSACPDGEDYDYPFRNDLGNSLKRRFHLYNSITLAESLTVPQYPHIPHSYKDTHITAWGELGSSWNPSTDRHGTAERKKIIVPI